MLYPQIIQVSQPMTQYWNPWWLGDTHGDLGPMTLGQNLHPIRLDARPLHVRVMPQTWEHHPGNMGKSWENDGKCGKTHYKQSVLNGKLWNIITLNGPNAGIFQPCLKMVASQGSLFAQDTWFSWCAAARDWASLAPFAAAYGQGWNDAMSGTQEKLGASVWIW